MSAVCPQGHTTEATDYCDVCGIPLAGGADGPAGGAGSPGAAAGGTAPSSGGPPAGDASASGGPASGGPASADAGAAGASSGPAAAGAQTCPNCAAVNPADALFCEACGYDFTTGAMPLGAGGQPAAEGDAAPAPGSAAAAAGDVLEWVAEVWVDPGWYEVQGSEDPLPSPGPPVVVPLRGRSLLVGRPSRSRNIHPEIDCSGDPGISRRQAQLTTDGRRWWVEDLQSSNGTYVAPASGPLPNDPVQPGQRRELDDDDRIYLGAWTRIVVRRATDVEVRTG